MNWIKKNSKSLVLCLLTAMLISESVDGFPLGWKKNERHGKHLLTTNITETERNQIEQFLVEALGAEKMATHLSLGAVFLTGLVVAAFACTTTAGRKNDMPIICNVFKPITFSDADSDLTTKQIDVFNKKWECYCEDPAPCAK